MKRTHNILLGAVLLIALYIGMSVLPVTSVPGIGQAMAQTGTTCANGQNNLPVLFWVSNNLFGCPAGALTWTILSTSNGPVSAFGASGGTGPTTSQGILQTKILTGRTALNSSSPPTATVTFDTSNVFTSSTSYWSQATNTSSALGVGVTTQSAGSLVLTGATGATGQIVNWLAVGN